MAGCVVAPGEPGDRLSEMLAASGVACRGGGAICLNTISLRITNTRDHAQPSLEITLAQQGISAKKKKQQLDLQHLHMTHLASVATTATT